MTIELRASVDVAVPIERAWAVWTDAARFAQWQGGVLAVIDIDGPPDVVGSSFVLDHGPKMKRTARVVAVEPPVRHVVEQTGVGVHDQTVTTFEPIAAGTRVTVTWYGHLNAVMRVLSRLDRSTRMQRELQDEVDRFANVAERVPGPARIGGRYVVEAGAYHRWVTVTGTDDGLVHVRLHPGHRRATDPDEGLPPAPKPIGVTMGLDAIPAPIRGGTSIVARGLPFLLRDGGHGVAHLALSDDAWADAAGRELPGDDPVTGDDRAAIEAWRRGDRSTVGADPTLGLAPLCTLRLGSGSDGHPVWGVAKVLKGEVMRVHLQVFGDRWPERPAAIRPWEHELRRMPDEEIEAGAMPDPRLGIGHAPFQRTAFQDAKPVFAGVTTRPGSELIGYEPWKQKAGGATFTTFQWVLDWPTTPEPPEPPEPPGPPGS